MGPAIGSNSFCGPAALASAFGMETGDAARLIREISGKVKVFGVSNKYMRLAIARLTQGRYRDIHVDETKRPSLERFCAGLPSGRYIVCVTGHYCAVDVSLDRSDIQVCDNHTIYPLALERYSRRRKHVKTAWSLSA